jgi:DNA mismatch endonuclease (patch repair protein)
MSAIRSKNTSPELKVFRELRKQKIHFKRHYKKALGTPDIAVPSQKKAIFIDGDFWHGFRYPIWKKRLNTDFWRNKIERNRERDMVYHRRLRRMGWKVIRVWEHQLDKNFNRALDRIVLFLSMNGRGYKRRDKLYRGQ